MEIQIEQELLDKINELISNGSIKFKSPEDYLAHLVKKDLEK